MIYISHRGNLFGPNLETENRWTTIKECLGKGINVEVDVWRISDKFYLGHDSPGEEINKVNLCKRGLWCHAKNLSALEKMLSLSINCFWHENDDFTLTSFGYIWTFPGKETREKSIIVDNSNNWREKNYKCWGVCSDYINL